MNMKLLKRLFLIFLCTASITSSLAAQSGQNGNPININPKFVVTDIQFAIQTLNTIELQGREVPAFMEVKGILLEAINKAAKANMKAEDIMEVPMPMLIGKNALNLLERATLAGEHADNYLRFTSALIAEIKRVESETQPRK